MFFFHVHNNKEIDDETYFLDRNNYINTERSISYQTCSIRNPE